MMTRRIPVSTLAILSASPALAHVGLGGHFTMQEGFLHPLHGADHLAQMVVVGLMAASAGGRALIVWPSAFVAAMIAGALTSYAGATLPYVELMIFGGLLFAAALSLSSIELPLWAGAAAIGAVGFVHGLAHGAEAPPGDFAAYVTGFAAATALLHLTGAAGGSLLMRAERPRLVRAASVAIALAGAAASLAA